MIQFNKEGVLAYNKAILYIPEIKKSQYSSIKFSDDTVTVELPSGKTFALPAKSVVAQDNGYITYKLIKRRILKGDFDIINGFLVDKEQKIYINMAYVEISERSVPKTQAQQEAIDKRAAALRAAKNNAEEPEIKTPKAAKAGRPTRGRKPLPKNLKLI